MLERIVKKIIFNSQTLQVKCPDYGTELTAKFGANANVGRRYS